MPDSQQNELRDITDDQLMKNYNLICCESKKLILCRERYPVMFRQREDGLSAFDSDRIVIYLTLLISYK